MYIYIVTCNKLPSNEINVCNIHSDKCSKKTKRPGTRGPSWGKPPTGGPRVALRGPPDGLSRKTPEGLQKGPQGPPKGPSRGPQKALEEATIKKKTQDRFGRREAQ